MRYSYTQGNACVWRLPTMSLCLVVKTNFVDDEYTGKLKSIFTGCGVSIQHTCNQKLCDLCKTTIRKYHIEQSCILVY